MDYACVFFYADRAGQNLTTQKTANQRIFHYGWTSFGSGIGGLRDKAKRYSVFSLARQAASYHTGWQQAWRHAEPKSEYDAVIIGGGGHGLATAYYLASVHGMTNIAVIEKGWLGGGNTGRNTTIIRSNYLWDESASIYEHALKLWEGLAQDLNLTSCFPSAGC